MHYCLRLPSLAAKDLKEFVKTGRWEEAREFLNDRTEGCTDQAGDKHGSSPPEYDSHNGFELARAARLGRATRAARHTALPALHPRSWRSARDSH